MRLGCTCLARADLAVRARWTAQRRELSFSMTFLLLFLCFDVSVNRLRQTPRTNRTVVAVGGGWGLGKRGDDFGRIRVRKRYRCRSFGGYFFHRQ